MEQLSAPWRHIINLIFPFSSRENSVSLISHALPLATLSCTHSSANLLWSNAALLLILKLPFFFISFYSLSNCGCAFIEKTWDVMLIILHILVIGRLDVGIGLFINTFITSIGLDFIKHTESKTQPFTLVAVPRRGTSNKALSIYQGIF